MDDGILGGVFGDFDADADFHLADVDDRHTRQWWGLGMVAAACGCAEFSGMATRLID
jgi:hypothetical protein